MALLTGAPLDLSQLPPVQLVAVDYETECANLIAGIVARFQAAGVPYDVQSIETDSAVILVEEFAYRKTLDLQTVNDAGKRLLLASSYGGALDGLAATYYADILPVRQPIVADPRPFAAFPGDWESDDRFRKRIQLAPEARTAGSLGSYEYFALTAAPALLDVRALNYASGLCSPGQVLVAVLGMDPNPDPTLDVPALDEAAQLVLAQNRLLDRDYQLGSDEVIVRAARRVGATTTAVLGIPSGPDPTLIVAAAITGLQSKIAEVGARIGELYTVSSQMAALTVGGVRRVRLLSSSADVDPGPDGVVKATVGAITTELVSV